MDPNNRKKTNMFLTQQQDTKEIDLFKEKIASFDFEIYKRELEIGLLRLENDLLMDSVQFFQRQLDRRTG